MQAIQTKYLPATNSRGSRIKASCERGSIQIPYPDELNVEPAHRAAVDALIAKFAKEDAEIYGTPADKNPWTRPYVTGALSDSYVHVYLS